MKPLSLTPKLRRAATRCLWFKEPEAAIGAPAELAAHILTYGLLPDYDALREQMSDDDLREALDNAPPGIFDARSWAYWNLVAGRDEAPPMPIRRFE